MKINASNILRALPLGLLVLSSINFQLSTLAQDTAFTYQGRFNDGSGPANGLFDLRFTLYDSTNQPGTIVAGPVTNSATPITNGLFAVTLNFGGIFTGTNYWLEIGARTNGTGAFAALTPRQPLTPAPYAIFANTASNLLGALPASQLSGSVGSAVNFTGNLNGDVTGAQSATVVSFVGGQSAANVAASAIAANAATSANTASTIVKRDASGNFSAGSATLAGTLTLPASTPKMLSGTNLLLLLDANTNFFFGPAAGNLTVIKSGNTGIGYQALRSDDFGSENTAIGFQTLYSNENGSANTAVGYQAMYLSGGSENTAIGDSALYTGGGSFNTADGAFALQNNTSGGNNTAVGDTALTSNTTGNANTAIGSGALFDNTNGIANTAVGFVALGSNTNGCYNIAIGVDALTSNSSGSQNTVVGTYALELSYSGSNNTASGFLALSSSLTGSQNTADGALALYGNTTGRNNLALGYMAGYNITTGSTNIDIGNQGLASDTNTIRIGSGQTNTFIAGIYNATAAGGVPVYITSSGQLGTITSSARFKQNIQKMDNASDVLLALQPVTFQYKPEIDSQGISQFGLIAEQVEKVDPDLVVHDQEHGIYTVRYEAVNAMLLNEFLKQHKTVVEQNAEIQQLHQSVAELKAMVSRLAQKDSRSQN